MGTRRQRGLASAVRAARASIESRIKLVALRVTSGSIPRVTARRHPNLAKLVRWVQRTHSSASLVAHYASQVSTATKLVFRIASRVLQVRFL